MEQQQKTHWRKIDNPAYMGAYCFLPNEEKAVTISEIKTEKIANPETHTEEEKIVAHFREAEKPLVLNVTNRRTIAALTESPYLEDWAGHGILLCVQKVKAFGTLTDCVRVRPVKPFICAACGGIITGFEGRSHAEIKDYTVKHYGKPLCAKCATEAKQKQS